MSNHLNLNDYSTVQLAELRGQARMNVAMLEKRGVLRSAQQNLDFTEQKALLKRLTRELKTRITQLPLL